MLKNVEKIRELQLQFEKIRNRCSCKTHWWRNDGRLLLHGNAKLMHGWGTRRNKKSVLFFLKTLFIIFFLKELAWNTYYAQFI